MSLKETEKLLKMNKSEENERRSFFKKVVYAAPIVVALGTLLKPTESKAGFGKPPSGSNWS